MDARVEEDAHVGTIVLLMTAEEATHFALLLTAAGSAAAIRHPSSEAEFADAIQRLVGPARLISFCNGFIVPERALQAFDAGCFNFHPGPPEYRGLAPSYFALRDGADAFGATFHTMSEVVDAGTIHAVRRFLFNPALSRAELDVLAYRECLYLAQQQARRLGDLCDVFQPSGDEWSGPLHTLREWRHLEGVSG